jgi:hypothetical protein
LGRLIFAHPICGSYSINTDDNRDRRNQRSISAKEVAAMVRRNDCFDAIRSDLENYKKDRSFAVRSEQELHSTFGVAAHRAAWRKLKQPERDLYDRAIVVAKVIKRRSASD